MIDKSRVIEMALELPGAASDMPFEDDFVSTVLRHGATGKWFGILLRVRRDRVGLAGEGETNILNLKCDPLLSGGLKQQYADILPAYHMNKVHWISIRLEGNVPEEMIRTLIDMSYKLTTK